MAGLHKTLLRLAGPFDEERSDSALERMLLEELRVRHQVIVENVSELIVMVEPEPNGEFRLVSVNQKLCTFIGKPRAQLEGRLVRDVLPLTSVEQLHSGFETTIRTRAELNKRLFTSTHRILDAVMTPLFDDLGRCVAVLSVCRDVTDAVVREQQQEAERRKLLEQHRLLVDLSLDSELDVDEWMTKVFPAMAPAIAVERVAFWRFAPDNKTLRCEKRFNAESGRWEDGLVMREGQGRAYFKALLESPLVVIDDLEGHPCAADLAPAIRAVAPRAMIDVPIVLGAERVGVLRFSGAKFARSWSAEDQRFATSLGHLLSLRFAETRRRSTDQKLRVADRMASLGTLAAGVAHEINNPLGFILGNLEFLKTELPGRGTAADVEELEEAIGDAITGARRIRDIVSDLKALSRDSDETTLKPIDIAKVAALSTRMAQSALRHRATVTLDVPNELMVLGNDSRLGQVFLNLVVNAAQAMPERPAEQNVVRVAARRSSDKIEISVTDNGAGMTEAVRQRIFDPFFTTKPVGVGTGLGLSIVHGIVTGMNGAIAVTSKVGGGTTFSLSFPALVEPEVEANHSPKIAPVSAGRRRILVVDDEAMSGIAIRRVLSEHHVETVTDAREALRRFEAGTDYDLVLCDLMMPMMTGMDLHEAVSEKFPRFRDRMIFITGGAVTEAARRFVDRQDIKKLNKPFDVDYLRSVVTSTLAS